MRCSINKVPRTNPRLIGNVAIAILLPVLISSAVAQTSQVATPTERATTPTLSLSAPVFIDRQRDGEIRAANLIGVVVSNSANETVGAITDVVFKADGKVTAIVIGVGGILGLGEKNVAVPYDTVAIATGKDGKRSATINAEIAALQSAPAYLSERTTFETLQDGVSTLAKEAQKKAVEIKDNLSAPAPAPSQSPAR
jgi:sporulation protein YlmC with PRC-barrel domain